MSRPNPARAGQQTQELVFCHECENEWYKDETHGLTCPACRSDFTEIIEQDFDPRAAQEAENPLHGHNPWANADDPDEDDIDMLHEEHFGHTHPHMPGTFVHRNHNHPINQDFNFMLTNMLGGRAMPPNFPFATQGGPANNGPGRSQSVPRPRQDGQGGNGTYRVQRQFGPIHFSFESTTSPANGPGHGGFVPLGPMSGDINQLFAGLFGPGSGFPHAGTQTGNAGAPPNPFAAMFGFLDPANQRAGDAVFSQEALDRVISQLMEQNPGGSAPGPAPAAAIRNLPRKKLTVEMLDERTGEAECSICMDNVEVGGEVVTLPCKHWFHFACAEAWLKEHDTCPVCRRGIMAKDGPADRPRGSDQAPLHNEDPVELGRRQSGTRENPYVVDESPTRDRRRPPGRRYSSHGPESRNTGGQGTSGSGIGDRVRSFFGGGGSSNTGSGSGSRNNTGW